MYYKFTTRAEKALELAQDLAMELGHNYIGTEHILYGLAEEGTGVASKVLNNEEVSSENIKEEITDVVGVARPIRDPETMGFTPRSKRVIENAFMDARGIGSNQIGTEHILIGILKEGDSVATRILIDLGADPQRVYNEIVRIINEEKEIKNEDGNNRKSSFNSTPTLNQFGNDLTKQAKEG